MQVLKVNQACQSLRKAYQDPEDRMENQDCPAHQVQSNYLSFIFQAVTHVSDV